MALREERGVAAAEASIRRRGDDDLRLDGNTM